MIKSIKDLNTTKQVSLAIAISFLGSVFYNMALVWSINYRLIDLPLTSGDFIDSFFLWLPKAIYILGLMFIMSFLCSYFDKDIPEEKLGCSKIQTIFRQVPFYIILVSILVLAITSFFSTDLSFLTPERKVLIYGLFLFLCITIYHMMYYSIPPERFTDVFVIPEMLFPTLIIVACCLGFLSGVSAPKKIAHISIDDKKHQIFVLRELERGVLGFDACHKEEKHMYFYPWSNVQKIVINDLSLTKVNATC